MGSRSMSPDQVSVPILVLLLPGFGLGGFRPVLQKADVDRVSVTAAASPGSLIHRDIPDSPDTHTPDQDDIPDHHDTQDDIRRVVRKRKVTRPRPGSNGIAIILENFDKPTLWDLLVNKKKRVGAVVLVNGKPAVIRKRKVGTSDKDDVPPKDLKKVKNGKLRKKQRVVNKGKKLSASENQRTVENIYATKKPQLKRKRILRKRLNNVL